MLKLREEAIDFLESRNFRVTHSQSNFLFVWIGSKEIALVKALEERGFLATPGSDLSLEGWIRFNIGTDDETIRFLEALTALHRPSKNNDLVEKT